MAFICKYGKQHLPCVASCLVMKVNHVCVVKNILQFISEIYTHPNKLCD